MSDLVGGWVGIGDAAASERPLVRRLLREQRGSEEMVLRGTIYRPAEERAVIAWADGLAGGQPVGLLTWRGAGGEAREILSLDAFPPGRGVGSALLRFLEGNAARTGCTHLMAVTTNDNLDALAFLQKRGFRLMGLAPGAVSAARAIKPTIPPFAANGIPIRDELTLEKRLDAMV